MQLSRSIDDLQRECVFTAADALDFPAIRPFSDNYLGCATTASASRRIRVDNFSAQRFRRSCSRGRKIRTDNAATAIDFVTTRAGSLAEEDGFAGCDSVARILRRSQSDRTGCNDGK